MHDGLMKMVEEAEGHAEVAGSQMEEMAGYDNPTTRLALSQALSLAVIARAVAESKDRDDDAEPHGDTPRISTFFVNGKEWDFKNDEVAYEVTYEEVLDLADFPLETNPMVTFSKALDHRAGTLLPGMAVHVQDGTVFNVAHTGNA